MKKILICFSVLVTFLHLYSCKSTSDIYNSWIGSHKSTLIQSWGPPSRYESDGKNGEILVFETRPSDHGMGNYKPTKEFTSPAAIAINNNYNRNSNRLHYTEMFVNENGIIYYWRNGVR